MIDFGVWSKAPPFSPQPWLILGKGPSFSCHKQFDLRQYNLLALNHVVRELKVQVAHVIDVDVIQDCGESIRENAEWLIMPYYPHVKCEVTPKPLEDFVKTLAVLEWFEQRGRLVGYNLETGQKRGDSEVVRGSFSAPIVLNLLGIMGAKEVRSLGIDGGRSYSEAFADLVDKTLLKNTRQSFDIQFEEMERTAAAYHIDYAALVEPIRIFVGTDQSQLLAAKVLEYSLRKHCTRPVEFWPMLDLNIPIPKDPANRPRTGFSFYRFCIPALAGYRGKAIYLDSDMIVFDDISKLWDLPFGSHKVLCSVQSYTPREWLESEHVYFKPGRQMSVMLLDCSRLNWDIKEIINGLDQGKYTYEALMSDLCLLDPDEIGDGIPPEWNSLERYEPGTTKLLHYTVMPKQPWKTDENHLGFFWHDLLREALQARKLSPVLIEDSIRKGHVKASLASAMQDAWDGLETADLQSPRGENGSEKELTELRTELWSARLDIARLLRRLSQAQADAEALRNSRSFRLGQALFRPLRSVQRALSGLFIR